MRRDQLFGQSGVSLIEALVALAVMAFGLLGVVGLQATMRQNVDVSKQRSEAVRLAQESIETARGFSVLTAPEPEEGETALRSYAVLAEREAPNVGYVTNTSYTVTRTIAATTEPRMSSLRVEVSWTDRLGDVQKVHLDTAVAGISPETAGSLGLAPVNGRPMRQPLGRNAAIPAAAVDASDKRSSTFSPATGVAWVFNNVSGMITEICVPTLVCTPANALLLSGFVVYATAPTPAEAETPTGTAIGVDLQVVTTAPTAATVACYSQAFSNFIAYFCAVPVEPTSTPALAWSGRLNLVTSASLPIATAVTEVSAAKYRVCRYTPTGTDTPAIGNIGHPLNYSLVSGPLTQQNFLVIRAGDGTAAYTCPADDSGTPFVNGNTWQHQPHS